MKMNKNIGIWIRVSTDKQVEDESPEHHEKRARYYAEAKGWNIVTVYRLDGLSGKSIMEYNEARRMLNDIKNGTISGLIFSKLARLARNTRELLDISELFRSHNADLISLAEAIDTSTPVGRLFFTVIAAMGQWEREEIADRVAASVPIRAKMGKPLGGAAPFGFRWENKELLIDEKEAPVRKLMYELYQQTKRFKATATELNAKGYRTRNGSHFTDTTIRRLIQDTSAKGTRLANYTKSLGKGKKWEVKAQEDWIEVPCPSIISTDLWEECNGIVNSIVVKRMTKGPRPVFLLSGLVECTCGKKMYVYNNNKDYKCVPCKRKIPVQDLDEIYHSQLKSFLLVNTDIADINDRASLQLQEKQELLQSVKTEYEKLKKRLEAQWNLRVEGELSKEDFKLFYEPLQKQLRQIEEQLPELEAEVDFLKIQGLSLDSIKGDAENLFNSWPDLPFEERRSIVEIITQKVEIQKDAISISLSYLPTPAHSFETAREGNTTMPLRLFQSPRKRVHLPAGRCTKVPE